MRGERGREGEEGGRGVCTKSAIFEYQKKCVSIL